MITIIAMIFFYIVPVALIIKVNNPLIVLLAIGIWVIDTIILYYSCSWWGQVSSTTPKLSYRAFIKLYNVMPEDFMLSEYDIHYKHILTDFKTFPDYWRYRHFHKNIEKHITQQEQMQQQAVLISELQRGLTQRQNEIDKFVKEHVNEISNGN